MGYSRTEYSYTGATQDFAVNFALGYLEQEDVQVYVVGEVDGLGDQVYRDYTWVDAGTVRVTDPIPNPSTVVVERTVDKDQLEIAFEGNGGVTRNTLSRGFRHLMMNIHELLDGRVDGFQGGVLDEIVTIKDEAVQARNEVQDYFNGVSGHDVLVDAMGAVGDGVTDDTAAFQAAIDAVTVEGRVRLSANKNYLVDTASLSVGSKDILWIGSGEVNSSDVWTLPGTQDAWTDQNRYIYNKHDGVAGDGTYKDNRRRAYYTGGAGGVLDYIEKWEVDIGPDVGSVGNRKAEKAGLFRVDNYSDHANGIALFAAAFAEAQGAVWAIEASTHSKVVPSLYAHRAGEFAISAYTDDPNGLRWIVDMTSHSADTTTYDANVLVDRALHIGAGTADLRYGIWIQDHDFNGAHIRNAGIRMETEADLIQAYGRGVAGAIKFGSDRNAPFNIVASLSGMGNTDLNNSVPYSQIRTIIQSEVDGAQKGQLQFYVADAGALMRKFALSADGARLDLSQYASNVRPLLSMVSSSKVAEGTLPKNMLFIRQDSDIRNDATTVFIQRLVETDDGYINPKALRVETLINTDTPQIEYAISGEITSNSNTPNNGQSAVSGTAFKNALGNIFASHFQVKERFKHTSNTAVTAAVGIETNIAAVGPDHPTQNNGLGLRRVIDVIARTDETVTNWNVDEGDNFGDAEIGTGVIIRSDTLTHGTFRFGLVINEGNASIATGARIDTTGQFGLSLGGNNVVAQINSTGSPTYGLLLQGTYGSAALRINSGQRLALNNSASKFLVYNDTLDRIEFFSGGTLRGFIAMDGTASGGQMN